MAKLNRRVTRRRRVSETAKLVVSAVKKLMKYTGWTARTITKFIRIEYGVDNTKLGRQVSRSLKTCVRQGLLQNDGGRYRLYDLSAVTRPSGATIESNGRDYARARLGDRPSHIHRSLRIHSPSSSGHSTRHGYHRRRH